MAFIFLKSIYLKTSIDELKQLLEGPLEFRYGLRKHVLCFLSFNMGNEFIDGFIMGPKLCKYISFRVNVDFGDIQNVGLWGFLNST